MEDLDVLDLCGTLHSLLCAGSDLKACDNNGSAQEAIIDSACVIAGLLYDRVDQIYRHVPKDVKQMFEGKYSEPNERRKKAQNAI